MPMTTFRVKAVSEKPERRKHRTYNRWFDVWTIEREPDDALPLSESLAYYEIAGPIQSVHAQCQVSLCQRALELNLPVTVLWKDSRGWREIVEITLAAKESAA